MGRASNYVRRLKRALSRLAGWFFPRMEGATTRAPEAESAANPGEAQPGAVGAADADRSNLTRLIQEFSPLLREVLRNINRDLRYDEDFGPQTSRPRILKSDFSVARYGESLTDICLELERKHGETVTGVGQQGHGEFSARAVLLVRVLQGIDDDRDDCFVRESLRLDLAGHVLAGVWSKSREMTTLNDFVRRFHSDIETMPAAALRKDTRDGGEETAPWSVADVQRLFKDAVRVAASVAEGTTQVPQSPQASPETPFRSSGYLLQTLIEMHRITNGRRLKSLMRSPASPIAVVALGFLVMAGVWIVAIEFIQELHAALPTVPPGFWRLALPTVSIAAGLLGALKLWRLAVRRTRWRSVLAGFRYLRLTKLVTQQELEEFIKRKFGGDDGDRLIRKVGTHRR